MPDSNKEIIQNNGNYITAKVDFERKCWDLITREKLKTLKMFYGFRDNISMCKKVEIGDLHH